VDQVVRRPYGSYSSEYRVQEYANPGYHHHYPAYEKVTEIVHESNPGYLPHGGCTAIIDRREEIIRENAYEAYRRVRITIVLFIQFFSLFWFFSPFLGGGW